MVMILVLVWSATTMRLSLGNSTCLTWAIYCQRSRVHAKGMCLFEEVHIDTEIAMALVGVEGREEMTDGETRKTGPNDRNTESLLR